jgi:hypothetical protein
MLVPPFVLLLVLLLVFVVPPQAINMQITKGKIQASENILIKDFIKLSFLILLLL